MIKLILKAFSLLDSKDKRSLIGIIGIILLMGLLETMSIGGILPLMQVFSDPASFEESTLYGYLGSFPTNDATINLILIVMSLFVVRFFFGLFLYYHFYSFTYGKSYKYSSRLLEHYVKRSYEKHLSTNSGVLLKNVVNEVSLYVNMLLQVLIIVSELIVITFILALLMTINIKVVFSIAIIGTVISMSILFFIKGKMGTLGEERELHNGLLYKYANELINGIKSIKVFGKEDAFLVKYKDSAKHYSNSNVIFHVFKDMPRLAIETIGVLVLLGVIGYSIVYQNGIELVLPTVSLFAMAALRLMPSLNRINSAMVQIKFYEKSVEIIHKEFEGLNCIPIINEKINIKNNLELVNISYSYPKSDKLALNNLSLNIKKRQKIAFVGFSGSGKTTLMDVLLGLLKPQNGDLKVDGNNLSWESLVKLRDNMSYIPQDAFLIDDTVSANVALGEKNIDMERLKSVLMQARLDQWVDEQPNGINSMVGDKGIQLSGGQKQRISIARALYRNPDILIMDEATSALDNDTERQFLEILDDISSDLTVIIVAHRLSTIQHCDIIYVMDKGCIINSGTHNELIKKCKIYQKLNRTLEGNENE